MKKLVLAMLLSATSMTAAHATDFSFLSTGSAPVVETEIDYSTWTDAELAAGVQVAQDEVDSLLTAIDALNGELDELFGTIAARDAIEQGPTTESYARDIFEGDGYLMMTKGSVVRYIVERSNCNSCRDGSSYVAILSGSVNGHEIRTARYESIDVNFASAYGYLADRGFAADPELLAEMM